MRLIRKESSASLLEILWGRIFASLLGICSNKLGCIEEESFASSMGIVFFREKSSAYLLRTLLEVF